ncbi:MAG: hypoxanthine-guanine phosphoribosyltransferase [Rhodanobacteraceae bacterium]
MSQDQPSLTQALKQSRVLYTQSTLDACIKRMGVEIDAALAGQGAIFITVMNGALVFAGHLAIAIDSPLEFDYVHATRYHSGTEGKQLEWLRRPAVDMQGRNVILVDDILDEGHTLKAVREACIEAGAERVLVAALCVKRLVRRGAAIEADFQGVEVPDAYVFGFGMDYHEQGRNLPDIHIMDVT